MILLHDLTAAFLTFAYPHIVTAIAGTLNAGYVPQ
jgi:hypothetical protein